MGFKTKKLELALSQKESELAGLRQRAEELGAAVERYRAQESAIAGALTRAQTAAEKILRDAEQEKAAMLRSAGDAKLEAEREARGIIADAERRAAFIEESAKKKARETASRAEGFMADYRNNAGKLVAEFRRTATMAMDQARVFAECMSKLNLEGVVEIAKEYDHVAALAATPAQDMPDDYVDSASLMRSIYAIEQRELPAEAAPAGKQEPLSAPEISPQPAPAWEPPSAPEIKTEPAPMWEPPCAPQIKPEPAPERKPEPVPLWEPEPAREPFTASIRPEPGKPAWEARAVELGKPADGERVWTVEEIIERTSATDSGAIDDELNAIIEDVLRGS
ncbi:MAG TPA: hypothetical protein PKW41_08115 [Clostridia bacterium]|jgi:hypothetical protein|nr:hypothetical protein [Clostridia bacterium]HPK15944.1 hypothetical protein [Clostridia bacterium]